MIDIIDDIETIKIEYENGETYWIAPLPSWEFDKISKKYPDENEFFPGILKAIIKKWDGIEFLIDGKKTNKINNLTLKAFYLKRAFRAWDLIRKARDPSTVMNQLLDDNLLKNSKGSSVTS